MSYNKTDALREKGFAEKLMISNDYVSARDKLRKAQQLFPALDNIIPMLTVCDILSASRNIIPGYDTDYYWVLHLMPSATDSDINYQYQKLVSSLKPIKNKFPGTDLALKLLLEAFSVLSDKKRRLTFDMKRGTCWVDFVSSGIETPLLCNRNPTDPERVRNLGPNLPANNYSEKACFSISLQESDASSSDVIFEGNKSQEVDTRVDVLSSDSELHCSSKDIEQEKCDQDFYSFEKNRTAECFEEGQIWAVYRNLNEPGAAKYAQISASSEFAITFAWLIPIPVTEGERRWCDVGLPVACGSFFLDLETSGKVNSPTIFSYKCSWVRGVTEEQFEIYPQKGEVWAVYEDWDLDEWSYHPDTIKDCKFKLVEMLEDYSKYTGVECACLVKVDGFKSVFERQTDGANLVTVHVFPRNLYMLSHNVPAYKFIGGERNGVTRGMFELDQLALQKNMIQIEEDSDSFSFDIPKKEIPSLKPNSEITVLGPNWSANDFTTGQVWAVYSGQDLMPQRYSLINNVILKNQVCVTFLEPEPILDHEIYWKRESLPIVCGIFRAKETSVNLHISQFSHQVICEKRATTPIYRIYPTKGEVWAVYQNWNNRWKHADYDNHKCCVVEILSDFSDGERTTVARLGEVKGCLTFFQRRQCEDGFDLVRTVSKNEMLCFSHRIPAFRVPGIGRHGIPESSWHLEPIALPPNLG